jgi:UDP-N-acetylmuramyl pentapeptide phosphotransferase/UDP-N-acetylglucosamine-1-phosphate transferase
MTAMSWAAILPFALPFALAFAAIRAILAWGAGYVLDLPNERSLHDRPVPRTGGLALLAGAAACLVLGGADLWRPLAIAAALAALSFLDDLRGVPLRLRLAAHLAAASGFAWHLLSPMHPAELALVILGVVWVTNLYNFMDGADGIAGGMALIGFGAYAGAAHAAGQAPLAVACVALAAASLAFLLHNFHPARLFLGDAGSIPLGFLAAALGLQGWRDDAWPLWFPLLVFGPFIGDSTLTLLRRLARRQAVWQAHREHYYQRMVRMGLGHRATAWIGYAAMLACAGIALHGRTLPGAGQAAAFGAAVALLAGLALWVDLRWSRFVRSGGGGA